MPKATTPRTFDPVRAKFIPLNVDQWLKDHKIAEDAKARGAEDLPRSDAVALGDQENKIVAWIHECALDCRQQVSKYLGDLMADLVNIEDDAALKGLVQEVNEIRAKAVSELEHEVKNDPCSLATRGSKLQLDAADFYEFRKREGLRRAPNYAHRIWALPVILICFVVETALNATLLMDVNAFGLVGSISQMGLISAVNILIVGLAMGALVRRSMHRSPVLKVVAWVGMVVILVAVVAFNLAVGHFRDSMQAVLSDPSADILALGNDALVRFVDGPFRLDSFQSALLALLGMLFFALASWKWLQRDDLYPGYGPRARQKEESEKHYADGLKQALARLKAIYEKYDTKLKDVRDKLELKKPNWEEKRLKGQGVRNHYKYHTKQYQLHLDSLLSLWRTRNQYHRSSPPPAYFATRVLIDQDLLHPPDFDPPEGVPFAHVTKEVHKAITELGETHKTQRKKYPSLSDILRRARAATGE